MIRLAGIFIYPVKSARGIALDRATLSDRGLVHDRRFLIVDESGRFVTQREEPELALIHTAIEDDRLTLHHAGRALRLPLRPDHGDARRVRVFDDEVDALDLGSAPRGFLRQALGRALSLVYMPDAARRPVDPDYADEQDIVSFADGFPFLLASESSLTALNQALPAPVSMERFRPNFVVEGAPAYAEDHFRALRIGDVPFLALKPSARCVIIDTDPQLGVRSPGPLAALARTHALPGKPRGDRPPPRRAAFGQNLVARGSGTVRVGDQVVLSPPP